MKTKSLFPDKDVHDLLNTCERIAAMYRFPERTPTGVLSDFWHTTFTPSSSESIFRHFSDERGDNERFCSCQPCIRITDLDQLESRWHLLLFHMFTFIVMVPDAFDEVFRELLAVFQSLLPGKEFTFRFLTSLTPSLPDNSYSLSVEKLVSWGIPKERVYTISGTVAYQNAQRTTADGSIVRMIGPKVEVFLEAPNDAWYEIGTFEVATAQFANLPARTVGAFVIGLERFASATRKSFDLARLPARDHFIASLARYFSSESSVSCSPYSPRRVIGPCYSKWIRVAFLLDALHLCSNAVTPKILKENRGVGNHFRRTVRRFLDVTDELGLPLDELFAVTHQELGGEWAAAKEYVLFLKDKFGRSSYQ